MACIYLATNSVNGKHYIGFSKNLRRRLITHKSAAARGSNYLFHKAIRKYGFDVFSFEVIYEGSDDRHTLEIMEPQFIIEYKPEYNLTAGGEGVIVDSFTDEHRRNLSKNHADVTGVNNPFYGRQHTDESKAKMSMALKGRIGPNKGRVWSEETKTRMSEAAKHRYKTQQHHMLGKTHSEETKIKMRKPKVKNAVI